MSTGSNDERLPSLAGEQRIGDAERERAAGALGEHFAAGRLDRAEFDVRLDAVYAAKTGAQLRPLFADLPEPRAVPDRPQPPTSTRGSHGEGRRSRPSFLVPPIVPILLLIAVVALATDRRFPFFVFPMLWFMGAFRRRRSW
jgi:hypothetical protein